MKRFIFGVVALGLFVGAATAQDFIFAFKAGYTETTLARHPCDPVDLKGPASMTVYDTNAWIVYTCTDDRVILRRYLNPNDNAQPKVTRVLTPQTVEPVCPAGFVHTKDGQGCVTPSHPLAR